MQFAWALMSGGFRIVSDTLVYRYRQVLGVCQDFSVSWRTGGAAPGTGFLHFSEIAEEVIDGFR